MSTHENHENITAETEAESTNYHVVCHDCEIESFEETISDAEYRTAIHPDDHQITVKEVAGQ